MRNGAFNEWYTGFIRKDYDCLWFLTQIKGTQRDMKIVYFIACSYTCPHIQENNDIYVLYYIYLGRQEFISIHFYQELGDMSQCFKVLGCRCTLGILRNRFNFKYLTFNVCHSQNVSFLNIHIHVLHTHTVLTYIA